MCRFNHCPVTYVDRSWLEGLPGGEAIDRLRNSPRVQARLSAYLLAALPGPDGAARSGPGLDYDFSAPYRRLVLLGGQQIGRLIVYLGLAVDSEHIQRVIVREELQRLKQAITEDGYNFATKRAPYLGPVTPELRGPAPAALSDAEALFRHFIVAGSRCLAIAFDRDPPGVLYRLRLKLPREWSALFPPTASVPASEAAVQAARTLALRVANELELDR